MKKKILFVCCEMGKGGVSKSLATLLNCLDYNKYNVDLQLFAQRGLFLEQVPSEVNVLDELASPYQLPRQGRLLAFGKWALSAAICKHIKDLDMHWRWYWRLNKTRYPHNRKKYDVAIAYNDGVELYYVVDCINAATKIGYNHTQYTNSVTYKPDLDRPYYRKADYLVTISDLCADALKEVFPSEAHKVKVIENIVVKEALMAQAGDISPYEDTIKDKGLTICTVAGLFMRKGFDLAATALHDLREQGYKFDWYILGAGPEEAEVKEVIERNGIERNTHFLYEKKNPYPYVRWADIFMLTSYAEGKSIAVEEAKLLERPILITNYGTAKNQIEYGKSGLIADMTPASVATELKKIFTDKELRHRLSEYLRNNIKSNKEENMKKLYALWGGVKLVLENISKQYEYKKANAAVRFQTAFFSPIGRRTCL